MNLSIKELSERTEIKIETLRGILKRKKVEPIGTRKNGRNPETIYKLSEVKRALKQKIKIVEIPTFYTKKEIEVYHIYESKMNYER
jgi:hypothetical protein